MNRVVVLFAFAIIFTFHQKLSAQLDISALDTDFNIDFDNTVSNVNNGQWASLVAPVAAPAVGELDSDAWSLTPADAGDFRGQNNGGVTPGGWYAFEVETGNYALGAQPTSGFNSHSIDLTLTNNTGEEIIVLDVTFRLYANNPQSRNATIDYSGASGINNSGNETTDYILTNGTATSTTWKYIEHSLNITNLSIANGATYTLTWSSDRGVSNDLSDEWALDDIIINAGGTSTPTITTTDVSGPFCVDATNSANVDVSYTTTGTFTGTFIAQLSDANGDFSSPTNIGTDAEPDDLINAVIPANTPSGTAYKIRVVNDMPSTEGTATADFEIINGVPDVSMEMGTSGDTEATIDWVNPAGCFDEILVVANETIGIDFTPMGDGTQYSVNTDYTLAADAVFLEAGTTTTVTGLSNGTTYYFEIFVRQGTNWSSGVEVSVVPDIPPTCEDFTNYPETSTTYKDSTFTGLDGSTWSYTQCNGAESIDDPSPQLGMDRMPLSQLTSGTISGGIGILTFDYLKAFSTDVNLEVYVNDVLVGTVMTSATTVQMANITVEVEGDFVLSFRQPTGAGQVVVDNVCWTSYTASCSISDIEISNAGSCNSNVVNDTSDDFYTADVTVHFNLPETTGTLDLTGDILGSPPSVDASTLMGMTFYTFTSVQIKADGTATDLTASFSNNTMCTYSETAVDAGMSPCCVIESVTINNTSACNDGGTDDSTDDDTFTTEVTVTFYSPPTMGTLNLSGDAMASVDVSMTDMPNSHTFMLSLAANGNDSNITASFSEDTDCSKMAVITGVASCSPNTPTLNGGLLVNELADKGQPLDISSRVGSPEYIELLVIGEAANPTLAVNVSGWIIDDNNSIAAEFGTTGESTGFLRIKSNCFTDVPPGSLIVIYNAGEKPISMPADDEDDTNPADNVYIIPSSSTCLEEAIMEILAQANYTTNTFQATDADSWFTALNYRNGADVVQTRRPDGSFYHGFAYGTFTSTPPYPNFPNGNASFTANTNNNVSFNCGNSTDINEFTTSTAFTPGAANNADNAMIIQELQNGLANYNQLIGTDMPSGCAILAVDLLDFTAHLEEQKVMLKWQTTNEKNNKHFEIEHSTNSFDFKKIGTVESQGDAADAQYYQFTHQTPTEGNNYYRLRQVDANDVYEFSFIQSIFYKKSGSQVLLYPIPVGDILNLDFSKTRTINQQLSLINANGQLLETIEIAEHIGVFELSVKHLPAGIYWIKLLTEKETVMKKFIKK